MICFSFLSHNFKVPKTVFTERDIAERPFCQIVTNNRDINSDKILVTLSTSFKYVT